MTKSEFIQTIRQFIAEGKTEEALDFLQQYISGFDTSMLTAATLLQNRFQNAHTDSVIKGILAREDYDRTNAQVNYAILELLEKIEKNTVINTGVPKDKNSGRILHNIPGTMPLAKETRCIVRIAYDDATLTRDFKTTDDTVIQSVRIAEVMGVELVDFNEVPAFQIRTINDATQFVANDDYTQWLFMVKPLLEGKYPLTLKVAVIEQIDGKERKRDIVLEKDIFIIGQVPQPTSAPPANEILAFEDTNMKLHYANDASAMTGAPPPSSSVGKKKAMAGVLSVFGVLVMAMTGLYVYRGGFSNKRDNTDIVINSPTKNASNHTKTRIDSIVVIKNDNIAHIDTSQKTNPIKNDLNTPKRDIISAVPTAPKPPKLPVKTPIKPVKSQKINTNRSELAGNTIKKTTEGLPNPKQDTFKGSSKSVAYATTQSNVIIKDYKVRIKLVGEMKDAEIYVNGLPPLAVKKNIWGTPQYVEFRSASKKQTFAFIYKGISCIVQDIEILNDEVVIEACSPHKSKSN
jgi:Effector-associated domain 11